GRHGWCWASLGDASAVARCPWAHAMMRMHGALTWAKIPRCPHRSLYVVSQRIDDLCHSAARERTRTARRARRAAKTWLDDKHLWRCLLSPWELYRKNPL